MHDSMHDSMHYIVSLSGGVASAVCADRAIVMYGRENIMLWIADTSWEDEDLWRFVDDCCRRWKMIPHIHRDGRTPLQVAEDAQIIPNQKIAPCSFKLKIEPFTAFLQTYPKPVTVLLGLDWKELHRHAAPKRNYESIEGVSVDFPLMWNPIEYRAYQNVVRDDWDIEPPRMYAQSFPHNNCGDRCVKQGIKEWLRLRRWQPERFTEVRDWEQAQRAKGGARATYAILRDQSKNTVRPLTLVELEQREQLVDDTPSTDDMFGCMCNY